MLRDDQRRAALIGELEAIDQALSAPSAATAPVAAATAPAAPAPASSSLTDDGLVRRVLAESSTGLRAAGQELANAVGTVNDLPDLAL